MSADAVCEKLKEETFRPFTVVTVSGRRHRVSQPDFAWITPGKLDLIIGNAKGRVVVVALAQITELRVVSGRRTRPR